MLTGQPELCKNIKKKQVNVEGVPNVSYLDNNPIKKCLFRDNQIISFPH